jgi:SAM-dependent methyltransferase
VNTLPRRTALTLLALVSASIVSVEVLLTRLLSVVTWYGLAFLVLSLAMLGLTSGSLAAMRARREWAPMGPWIARRLAALAMGLLVATVIACATPLHFAVDLTSFGAVLLVIASATAPMVAGGAVVARLMAESEVPLPVLYAVDLVAAAAGALLPLVLLGPLSAPAALALIAGVLALAALPLAPPGQHTLPRALAATAALVVLLGTFTRAGLEPRYLKGAPRPASIPAVFEAWNPLSFVYLSPFAPGPFPLWSPSPATPPATHVVASAYIDGEAGTPVYAWSDLSQLNLLRLDATTAAHALRPTGTACVIGIGGGRDLAAALLYGHDEVHGVEINPAMVAMLRAVERVSPILADPRVHYTLGDGRAVLARSSLQCRVLQASLVDTWAATSAGAFAHTESTLYTREAWSIFLRRVEPDGVLTFSRWYDPRNVSETSRLVSLAIASLLDRGVARPRDHVALLASGRVATILVSPAPLSPADVTALEGLERRFRHEIVLAPGRTARDPLLERLLAAGSIPELSAAGESYALDTSPPTDDRPFFFQLLAARAWLHPLATWRAATRSSGALAGNAASTLQLAMTFLAAALVGMVLLGPTLWRAARERVPPLPGARAAMYFAGLGAGFMLAEVALVQRMHVVLGHPTYSLVVVLAGLLVATGMGSALSPRVLRSRRSVSVAALGAAVVLAALPFVVIGPLARATLDAPFAVRVAWTGATSALVGLLLGMLFPSGLRYVARERGAPVALALNGATSVLGSVAAVLVSVWAGIPASFALAGVVYALVAVAGPWGWRPVDD